jgi:hypothetical protein
MITDDYPNLWKRNLIQPQVRKRANHRCEQCGMEFDEGTNLATTARNKLGNPMIGTVHHIDQNKQNCSMANLVYLCQSCHWILHIENWTPGDPLLLRWGNIAPAWIVARNIPYQLYPQLSLFEEIYEQ